MIRRVVLAGVAGAAVASVSLTVTLAASGSSAPSITEFASGISRGAAPEGIVASPDGAAWFTEPGVDKIGRITPSGTVTEFTAGTSAVSNGLGLSSITVDSAGNLWYGEGGADRIATMTPAGATRQYSIFPYDTGHGMEGMVFAPDGTFWVVLSDGIAKVGLSGDDTAQVTHVTGGNTAGDSIVEGPDGNIWFTDPETDTVGKITPADVVTRYAVAAGSFPDAITVGPDGNLWFTENFGGIGKVTPAGVMTEYTAGVPPLSVPEGIASGPDGNLWFTEAAGGIAKITTAGVVTSYSAGISAGAKPDAIARAANGTLWFTENGIDRIAQAVVAGSSSPTTTTSAKPKPKKNPRHKALRAKRAGYAGTWRGTLSGTITTTDANGSTTTSACCSQASMFTVSNSAIGDPHGAPPHATERFVVWSPGPPNTSGVATLSSTIVGYNDSLDPPLPCTFLARFSSAGTAQSIGAISCQYDGHFFNGSFRATRTAP